MATLFFLRYFWNVNNNSWLPIICFFLATSILIYLIAIWKISSLRWKLFFGALIVVSLIKIVAFLSILFGFFGVSFSIFQWLSLAYTTADIALIPWILIIALIDHLKRVRRDWLHWLGIVTFIISQSSSLIWSLGSWLLDL